MNYSFYLLSIGFLYLVPGNFSALEGRWLAMAPPLAAAAGARHRRDDHGRFVPSGQRPLGIPLGAAVLPFAGALLLLSVSASNPC
jgi:hypothetical protein